MSFRLKHDVTMRPFANVDPLARTVRFPKGTLILHVEGKGGGYAIASKQLVITLTGNHCDPHHRYVWVQREDVEEFKE